MTRERALLPLALGFADGILNALTLAAGHLVDSGEGITVAFAVRIGIAGLVTAGFAVFVADYAEGRGALRHASHQLSMHSDDDLAGTALGRRALRHAADQAALAAGSSFVGAAAPLLLAVVLPGPAWIAAVVANLALGALGATLAGVVLGSRLRWAVAMVAGGVALTATGAWIHIV